MPRVRFIGLTTLVLGVAVGGPPLLSGCGGSDQNEVIKPEAPPAMKAKESMDNYLKSMKTKPKHGAASK